MEERPGRRAHHHRVVGIDARAREDHAVGPCGIRGSDDGARVARIAHLVEDRDQLRAAGQQFLDRDRELPRHGDNPLRRDRVCHGLEHVVADDLGFDPGCRGRPGDVYVAIKGGLGHEQVDEQRRAELQRLGHRLRPLHEEQTGLFTRAALGQLGHSAHTRRTRVVDHLLRVGRADER